VTGRTATEHATQGTAPRGVLAERLDLLIATVHPAGRGPYTLREIASAINAEAGASLISAAYISQLRTGQRTEPSHSRLAALARFFGVETGYFTGEVTTGEASRQLEIQAALRDDAVRSVALRAAGLSESSLAAVRAVIENARRLEGLPGDGKNPP
jgi:transcriptional regulator with XRE-family HTH domain